ERPADSEGDGRDIGAVADRAVVVERTGDVDGRRPGKRRIPESRFAATQDGEGPTDGDGKRAGIVEGLGDAVDLEIEELCRRAHGCPAGGTVGAGDFEQAAGAVEG